MASRFALCVPNRTNRPHVLGQIRAADEQNCAHYLPGTEGRTANIREQESFIGRFSNIHVDA
jgi:hypothetical protein